MKKRRLSRERKIIHDKWKKYKAWQKKQGSKIRDEMKVTRLSDFEELYHYFGDDLRPMKSKAIHKVDYKNREALKKRYKESRKNKLIRDLTESGKYTQDELQNKKNKTLLKMAEEAGYDIENYDLTGEKLFNRPDFANMSTREWADIMRSEIDEYNAMLKARGLSSSERALKISQHFFGSP